MSKQTLTPAERLDIYYKMLCYFEVETKLSEYVKDIDGSMNIRAFCFAACAVFKLSWAHFDERIMCKMLPELALQQPPFSERKALLWFDPVYTRRDDNRCKALYAAIELVYKNNPELYV